jgi:hypothetical protein
MPKMSKQSALTVEDFGPALDISGQVDEYTVDFVTIHEGHSLDALLKGLPDDRCQCPHWGYLFAGSIMVRYSDHEEVFKAGDAFYMSPGHIPSAEAGTEFVQFSPTRQLAEVIAAIKANAQTLALMAQPTGGVKEEV